VDFEWRDIKIFVGMIWFLDFRNDGFEEALRLLGCKRESYGNLRLKSLKIAFVPVKYSLGQTCSSRGCNTTDVIFLVSLPVLCWAHFIFVNWRISDVEPRYQLLSFSYQRSIIMSLRFLPVLVVYIYSTTSLEIGQNSVTLPYLHRIPWHC